MENYDIKDLMYQTNIMYDCMMLGETTVSAIEEALESKDYSKATVSLILNNIETIKTTAKTNYEPKVIYSLEDFHNSESVLLSALEESRGLISKLMGFYLEIKQRLINVINMALTKIEKMILKIFQDLKKQKELLIKLRDEKQVTLKDLDYYITHDNILDWQGVKVMSFLLIDKGKDPLKSFNDVIDTYCDPKYPERFGNALVDFLDKKSYDKLFDQDLYKLLDDNQPFYKVRDFFCKSKESDRLILGFNLGSVDILERCKVLNVRSSLIPFKYSIHQANELSTSKKKINVSGLYNKSIDDLIDLIDKTLDAMDKSSKYENEIHALMNNSFADRITDKLTWENKNFYNIYAKSIHITATNYANIFIGVDGFIKFITENLEEASKKKNK